MRFNREILRTTAFLVALLPRVAWAHPGHGGGFSSGFLHPITDLDHLIAMLAIGLWDALERGEAAFQLPVAILSMMMAAGAIIACVLMHAFGARIGFALNTEVRPAPMRIAGGVISVSGLFMAVGAL